MGRQDGFRGFFARNTVEKSERFSCKNAKNPTQGIKKVLEEFMKVNMIEKNRRPQMIKPAL